MATIPYLHFPGTCREALDHYARVLGGTDLQVMRYGESPDAPAAWSGTDRIMHGQVTLGDGVLMASDFPPGVEGGPQAASSVMQTFPTAEAARAAYDALLERGEAIQPFGPTFFAGGFGMLRDRFGTHWILTGGAPAA